LIYGEQDHIDFGDIPTEAKEFGIDLHNSTDNSLSSILVEGSKKADTP
jgi:hypothetical protein